MKTEGAKTIGISSPIINRHDSFLYRLKKSKILLLMVLPAMAYFLIFCYKPMYGIIIAFKDYSIFTGIWASPWVGFKYFKFFVEIPDFWKLIRNTFLLSFYSLLWRFPLPIIFALFLNEIKNLKAKKFVQTVSYMPHFISTVVVASMVMMFLSPSTGVINNLLESMGMDRIYFLGQAKYFRTIYIASGLWQSTGWASIIYIAAITNIDPQLYESAHMDGANKLKQILHITLPSIAPTIVTLLLLDIGHIMSVGFEKVFLLQNPIIYDTADVISTYVYRQGIKSHNYSYATAIDLFNSAINLILLITANKVAKHVNETSLW